MSVLFRLIELSSGSVHIDGVDISKLGLRRLRSGLSIIPQDALLFSGTVRSNLDPFSQYDDAKLWDALRKAHVISDSTITAREDGEGKEAQSGETVLGAVSREITLDTPVDVEGVNLSAGQRSLLSLARAICKDSQIVVMDEATARYARCHTAAEVRLTIWF